MTIEEVKIGITKFVDNEIIPKISGWQRWILGAGTGMALNNAEKTFNYLKTNPIVKMLNVIDENDNINIDEMYQYLHQEAVKTPITVDLPTVGRMTLTEKDVEKLYQYMKGVV